MKAERIRELINYDPKTGVFMWPVDAYFVNQSTGRQAGTIVTKGYRHIMVGGRRWAAHRLAWFYMTGEMPKCQIDHINGDPDDNRFCNLREASNAQNKRNAPLRSDTSSGFKCVSKRGDKWSVSVQFPGEGRQKKCGVFVNLIDAVVCANYNIAYGHGEFARLNPVEEGVWSHD